MKSKIGELEKAMSEQTKHAKVIGIGSAGSRERSRAGGNALARREPPSLWKGALAGLIGGLAGSGAKLLAEKIFPPRTQGQLPPPVVLAEKVAGHRLRESKRKAAMKGMHWTFGPAVGAIYGAAVEYEPALAARHGVAFGLGVNALTHEGVLPKLGLAPAPKKQPRQERWSEAATHALYGFVTETVRKAIRGR
jgi:putative membrane protein